MVKRLNGSTKGPYTFVMEDFFNKFRLMYRERKAERKYLDELPMTYRGWRMSLVQADPDLFLIVSFLPHLVAGNEEFELYWSCDAVPNDAEGIAKCFRLGEIVDAIRFPLDEDVVVYPPDQRRDQAIDAAASEWATRLADIHMARTRPSFDEANHRMMDAYGKLFELEHALRTFIEQTLRKRFEDNWWTKATVNPVIRENVEDRRRDKRSAWLDDLETSILSYVDFPDLRVIIMDNQSAFRHILGPKEQPINWFTSILASLEPLRNRIGHVNTLSTDDFQDFHRDSNRILAAIRPKT